jgi:hypothetical protein
MLLGQSLAAVWAIVADWWLESQGLLFAMSGVDAGPFDQPPAGREYTAPEAKAAPEDDFGESEAAAIDVGRRCCVDPGERRGEVK